MTFGGIPNSLRVMMAGGGGQQFAQVVALCSFELLFNNHHSIPIEIVRKNVKGKIANRCLLLLEFKVHAAGRAETGQIGTKPRSETSRLLWPYVTNSERQNRAGSKCTPSAA